MKRVLVTGATGFIGNYVIQHLLQKGRIPLIASSARGRQRAREQPWFSAVEYIPLDLAAVDPAVRIILTFFAGPIA